MKNISKKDKITSLELLEQINIFRRQEGNKSELQHKTLLEIIRDEFEEEISQQKILPSVYRSDRGREYPMFELTYNQAKQVLARESKIVRGAIFKYIEELENKIITLEKIVNSLKPILLEYGVNLDEVDPEQIDELKNAIENTFSDKRKKDIKLNLKREVNEYIFYVSGDRPLIEGLINYMNIKEMNLFPRPFDYDKEDGE